MAGESLRDELMSRIGDMAGWAFAPLCGLVVAILEWYRYWADMPPNPTGATVMFAILAAVAGWRMWRINRGLQPLILGVRGERVVGQMLDELRADGYRVIHDLQQDGFNIDHILVGPGGVFAVETKTISMPGRRRPEVRYDGERVLVNGFEPDRNPVSQAAANADRVRDILKRTTGRDVQVRPVVLYPSWFVHPGPPGARVWVLNPKAFLIFVRRERRQLRDIDVADYFDRLAREAREDRP